MEQSVNILALLTEAHGGYGGISVFNQFLLSALSEWGMVNRVNVLARKSSEMASDNLFYLSVTDSKLNYVARGLKSIFSDPYDLIVCGHINLLPLAALCSFISNKPLILIVHGIEAWEPHCSFISRWALRHVAAVISVSDLTRERFVTWSGVPDSLCNTLFNTIDFNYYRPGAVDLSMLKRWSFSGKHRLITVARLDENERYKGIDEVIDLLPKLLFDFSDLQYIIVGDGSDLSRLKTKVRSLGLQRHVCFTGRVSEDEKLSLYRSSTAFVMPGSGEGFGIVYLEALACGLPVVGSCLDGSRAALLEGELGALPDPRDKEELYAAIVEALKQEKRVPEGLNAFHFERFKEKLYKIIIPLLSISRKEALHERS